MIMQEATTTRMLISCCRRGLLSLVYFFAFFTTVSAHDLRRAPAICDSSDMIVIGQIVQASTLCEVRSCEIIKYTLEVKKSTHDIERLAIASAARAQVGDYVVAFVTKLDADIRHVLVTEAPVKVYYTRSPDILFEAAVDAIFTQRTRYFVRDAAVCGINSDPDCISLTSEQKLISASEVYEGFDSDLKACAQNRRIVGSF